ncbi:MAG: TonB-dependent siderophore receptor [Rhodospirillaceae bacterium]|nr:MAG: TonB-dependent siderophore receptor [Rhodospirillaceae bacterium]
MVAPTVNAADATANTDSTASTANGVESVTVVGIQEHYRGDIPVKELPQSMQTISGDLLNDLHVTRLDNALDLVSGVARQNNFGGVWDSWAIRGFAGDENVPSGFLINGFQGGRGFAGPRDVSNIDRIEVLKGPASALYGRGEPGGTVNIITKKPQFDEQGSATLSGGSYDNFRGEGDVTGPITQSIAARLNGAYEHAHSFRDTVQTSKYVITPSILAQIDDATTVSEEVQVVHQEVPFDRGIPAINGVLGAIPNSRFLGEPGNGPNRINAYSTQTELQRKLGDNWVALAGFGYLVTSLKGFGEDPEFGATRNPFFKDGQTLARRRIYRDYNSSDAVPRAEVSGHFDTWSVVHHMLVGADYEGFRLDQVQLRYRPPVYNAGTTLAQSNAVNVFNPVYGNLPAVGTFTNKLEKDKTWGMYAHDQMDITDQIKLRVGVRYDHYHQTILDRLAVKTAVQTHTATSPTVGLVYEPIPEVSLYANYGKGFRPNTGFSAAGTAFQPEGTKSYEVGAKYESSDKSFNASVALFKTNKTNVLTADPVNAGFSITAGNAESKGVEFEANGHLPLNNRVWFTYSYIDAHFTNAILDPDFALPVPPGAPLINVPKNSGNLLLMHDMTIYDHAFSFGAGINYVDKRLGQTGTAFYLPSYTLVKLVASYDVTDKVTLSGEISNLLDKVYYPSSYAALWVNPGAPREFNIKATYRF